MTPWRAVALPEIRTGLARGMGAEAGRCSSLIDRAARIGRHDYTARMIDTQAQYQRLAAALPDAELFWVTKDMARAAVDASQDCPGILRSDMPANAGVLAFAEPLPAYPVPDGLELRDGHGGTVNHPDPVPVDAVIWTLTPDRFEVHLCCRPDRLPLPLYPTPMPLVPFTRCSLPSPNAAFQGLESEVLDNDGLPMVGEAAALGPLALLSTAWVLMRTPTMAALSQSVIAPGRGKRSRNAVPGTVTLVDVRPVRHVHTTHAEPGDGRHLTTRHRVRGHWKHQVHGPGRADRKIIWVPDYVRGPEGAPYVASETVYVWRR